jgi:hypothetical protein
MDLGVAFHEYSPERMRFIADQILPVKPVAKEASTLSVIKRKNLTMPETKHADGAVYNRVVLYADDMSYGCVDHGLEGQLTDRQREKFRDDFDGELETVNGIKTKMMIAREKRVKDLVFNTTTWTGSDLYTDNSGSPWDTATTDIISQVNAAKEKVRLNTGVMADSLIIGEASMQNLLKNDDIIARFPGVTLISEAMLRANIAAIFGIQQLIVGAVAYNSADEGQDFSATDLWVDDYAMVAALGRESMPMSEPQLGRTILWEQYIAELRYVEQYREEQTKSDIFRVEESVDEKLFDAYFAHLMKIDVTS